MRETVEEEKMNIVDIVLLVALIVLVIIGIAAGFGKSLRRFTKGIVGVILSIFICAALGGAVLGIGFIGDAVSNLGARFASMSSLLGKLHLELVVFYVIMFIVVQILRIIIVKFVCKIFSADNKAMKITNAVLGAIFVPAVSFVFLLLALAVMSLLSDIGPVREFLTELDGTFLYKLYEINPIVLSV